MQQANFQFSEKLTNDAVAGSEARVEIQWNAEGRHENWKQKASRARD